MDLGLIQAGNTVIRANDIDKDAVANPQKISETISFMTILRTLLFLHCLLLTSL